MTPHEILLAIVKTKKAKNIKGIVGWYCQLCHKYTESKSFSDHVSTKKHCQLTENLNFERRKMIKFKKCVTCQVWLFGDDFVWKEHQNLQVHKELAATTVDINKQCESSKVQEDSSFHPNESSTSGFNDSEACDTEYSSPEGIETPVSEAHPYFNESGPHYDFMKTILKKHLIKEPTHGVFGFFCQLCQLNCLAEEEWKSHFTSSSHKTKMDSPEYFGKRVQYNCDTCNIQLICEEEFFNLHLQSLAHKAISRIPAKTQELEESESEEDYSDDRNNSSEDDESNEVGLNTSVKETPLINLKNAESTKNNKQVAVSNGIFFVGLPKDIEYKEVVDHFKKFGPLKSCAVNNRKETGRCIFKRKNDAELALQVKTIYIRNKAVTIRPLVAGRKQREQHVRLNPDVVQMFQSSMVLESTVLGLLTETNRNFNINMLKVEEIKHDLSATIPGCTVWLFGSQVTGLATGESDFDIYIDIDGKSFHTDLPHDKQQVIIDYLEMQLNQRGSKFVVKEKILEARVPIIKVVHMRTNTPCDISCQSGLSVQNSKLVRLYLDLDPRVRWLVVAVKLWMQANGLLNRDVFTSYATVWLVLFFLLRTSTPVICPVTALQRNCKPYTVARWDCRFQREMKDIKKWFRSYNRQSELELLSAFFEAYSSKSFNLKDIVLCPLNGAILTRQQFVNLNLPREFSPYLDKIQYSNSAEKLKIQTPMCLQDPFDLSHNITKGVNRTNLNKFTALCLQSYNMCQNMLKK